MASDPEPSVRAPFSRPLAWFAAGLGAMAGLAAVYGIEGFAGNPANPACVNARGLASKLEPLMRGEVAAMQIVRDPQPAPDLAFQDRDGKTVRLADFRGRTVLLNLWATWCLPCKQEMPALDELQAKLGGPDFQVVAVNIDTRNLDRPAAWLREANIQHLAYYADPAAKVFQDLKAVGKASGMPTTLLIDPAGCELANLAGPAEWASPEALKLIGAALGRGG
jgi:thiol-disulfide isomerase/thioredoxin